MLTAVSPIDGRYASKTEELSPYFSEFGLIRYRILIEIEYFIALCELPIPQLADFDKNMFPKLREIYTNFSVDDAQKVKDIEKVTNHDVKAVEYFIKEAFDNLGFAEHREFIHFGLTSQDINNSAVPLQLKDAFEQVYLPLLKQIVDEIAVRVEEWKQQPMLARTHGQPATPTTVGREFEIFMARINQQLALLQQVPFSAKFGGATGNFNAHHAAYPATDWHAFADQFISELGMSRSFPTTQIEHYDNLAAFFQGIKRINTILIDFCRDIWTYISMEYFKQKVVKGEVGSSAMPHKVNPIDFENAEGNLGVANAIFTHLADKLPISRLQRDLTDSTVSRNIGVPFGHTLIAFKSILKGMSKLLLNSTQLDQDLEDNRVILAEAIQNILRREGFDKPYEALKALTRSSGVLTKDTMLEFVETLDVSDAVKAELRVLEPHTYLGRV